jgi:hypothetical protein
MKGRTTPPDLAPDSEEAYEVARFHLKQNFAVWCEDRGVELGSDVGEAPIHYKWAYLDGHLNRWTCDDLDEVYLELHPAKVVVEEDDLGSVLAEAKSFISFLDESGILDPTSDNPDVLLDHLGHVEGQFRSNMGDASRYSIGKRFWVAAVAEGVQLDDEKAVNAFMETFNARSRAERGTILGGQVRNSSSRAATGRFTPPGTIPRPRHSSSSRRRRRR